VDTIRTARSDRRAALAPAQVLLDTEGIDAYDQVRADGTRPGCRAALASHHLAVACRSALPPCPPPPPHTSSPPEACLPAAPPADDPVQHADLLPGRAAVQPVCVQPDGRHRRGGAGPPLAGHRDDQAHPRQGGQQRRCGRAGRQAGQAFSLPAWLHSNQRIPPPAHPPKMHTPACIWPHAHLVAAPPSAAAPRCAAAGDELREFTPSFMWLLRDFYLTLEEEGRKITPRWGVGAAAGPRLAPPPQRGPGRAAGCGSQAGLPGAGGGGGQPGGAAAAGRQACALPSAWCLVRGPPISSRCSGWARHAQPQPSSPRRCPLRRRDYLETALFPVPSNGPAADAKNTIRSSIKALFPDRDCFTLVRRLAPRRWPGPLDLAPAPPASCGAGAAAPGCAGAAGAPWLAQGPRGGGALDEAELGVQAGP
jgi:hypothetical protein